MKRIVFLATLLLPIGACAQVRDRPNFYQPKQIMKNGCSKFEQARLRREVVSIAGKNNPNQAWEIVTNMLCGETAKSKSFVLANTAAIIVNESNSFTSDGSTETETVGREAVSMVGKEAWDTSVVSVDGVLRTLFDCGGVCTGSFDLRYKEGNWKIVAISSYCD
jgi:hypothetical protein